MGGACPVEKITYPGSGNNSQFTFDGLGRNVKIVESTGGSPTSTKQFVWSGNMRCEERDGSGALSKQFFKGGQRNSSTSYFYTKDNLGSIREMTDTGGNLQAQYSFDPYGRVSKIQGSQTADFQFTGAYMHNPTGLLLTLNRAYSAPFGRWISRDPIEEGGGVNLFIYVENNPVSWTDSLGLMHDGCDASAGGLTMPPLGEPVPPDPRIRECWDECWHLFPFLGPLAVGARTPVLSTGTKLGGSTVGTSIASAGLRGLTGKGKTFYCAPTWRVWGAETASLGGAVGRWTPIIGVPLSLMEYATWLCCMDKCKKRKGIK